MDQPRRPTRGASNGVLIGGLAVLAVAVGVWVAGAAEAGLTLAAVAVGIITVGAAFSVWTARRGARGS